MKVLIVEDDLSTRKGIEESIKELGGEARSVGTAKEAVRAIEEFDPRLLMSTFTCPTETGSRS